MDIVAVETAPDGTEADVLAFAVAEPLEPGSELQALDRALGGRIERLIADGELTAKRGKVTTIHAAARSRRSGSRSRASGADPDADALRTAAAASRAAARRTVAWVLDPDGLPVAEQARAVADGLALGRYDAGRWKTDADRRARVETLSLLRAAGGRGRRARAPRRARGRLGEPRPRPRERALERPTPIRLAEVAEEIAERFAAISVEVLGQEGLEKAGMGALLSVAQGSHNPPQLVTLRYEPETPANAELVLGIVGKGITFDSGGLSLKPAASMEDMKSDMAGAAAAFAALGAIAELELPVRALAVVPACENMPSGHATRPGDVVAPRTARRSRSTTRTPRAGSSSPTRSTTPARRARPTSSTSRR